MNGKNPKRNTGLPTGAGEPSPAMNSRKPRLFGKFPLIEGEDPDEFYKFEEQAYADFKPEGTVERYFVERWIKDAWWLDRFDLIVAAFLVGSESLDDLPLHEIFDHLKFITTETSRRYRKIPETFNFFEQAKGSHGNTPVTTQSKPDVGSREDSRLTLTMDFVRDSRELSASELILLKHLNDRLRKASSITGEGDNGAGEQGALSAETTMQIMVRTYSRNREALELAFRFRANTERSRNNSLHELERLQAARQGQIVPAPELLDANVNFDGKSKETNCSKITKRTQSLWAADRTAKSKRR